jgi:succinate dehydrogenase/fumarate reductase-like Fe-S protein
MIITTATHQKLAGEIQRLIQQEQYSRAQELLPNFAQAVVEACNASGKEQEFLQAKQFLQSAVVAVKSRQAHYMVQMDDLGRQRAYTGVSDRKTSFDISG